MQPKARALIFKSELAPWFYAFFEEKYRLGYKYKSIDAYLMSFDRFNRERKGRICGTPYSDDVFGAQNNKCHKSLYPSFCRKLSVFDKAN